MGQKKKKTKTKKMMKKKKMKEPEAISPLFLEEEVTFTLQALLLLERSTMKKKTKKMACTVVMVGREAKEDTTVEDSVDTMGREAKADTTPPMMVAKVEEAAFRWLVETEDSVERVDTVGREGKEVTTPMMIAKVEEAAFRCLVEMLEQKMKKKKMACTVIIGETHMVGREAKEARVATTVGDYSFYSEVQGIVALFGGSDYLGDADEVVGFYGGKGGKGFKGGYGFYEENVIP